MVPRGFAMPDERAKRGVWYIGQVRLRPLVLVAFASTALMTALFVPGADSMRATTNPSVYVVIHVTLTSSKVVLYPKSEPRGASARFIIHNTASKPVTFSVGAKTPGLGDLFGFRRVFKPGKQATLLLYLSDRGTIPYYVGESYAQAKPSERGKLLVGATCSICAPPGPPLPP